MKGFTKRKGWLFPLKGGPNDGVQIRIGWLLPSGERIPLDSEIRFPSGAIYKRQQARTKSGELRFNKDGSEYWEYVWVEGSGERRT